VHPSEASSHRALDFLTGLVTVCPSEAPSICQCRSRRFATRQEFWQGIADQALGYDAQPTTLGSAPDATMV
jgi:hypothetical protein